MFKPVRLTLFICIVLVSVGLGARQPVSSRGGNDWRIEQVGEAPYLIYNGMPYFGRFKTDNPRILLHGLWEFVTDPEGKSGNPPSEGWEPMSVPGVWNYLRPEMLHYIGVGWYRHKFRVGRKFKGDIFRLMFGGVNMRCRAWLNGKFIGAHEGGYTAFSFDVTDALKLDGENTIVVRVDNRMTFSSVPPLNYEGSRMGWFEYGGIHRNVYLEAHPEVTVFKLAVRTLPEKNDSWKIKADVLLWDKREDPSYRQIEFKAKVLDKTSGSIIATLKPSAPFKGETSGVRGVSFSGVLISPRLWSPDDPCARYKLKVALHNNGKIVETASTDFGVRHFEAGPKGLFLNGKPYYIRGINRHVDDPVTGLVETPDVLDRDIKLLKSMHVNHMRTAHYPGDPLFYDLTDIRGIGVTEEIPLYQAGVGWLIWLRDRVQRRQKIGKMHFGKVNPGQFREPQLVRNAVLCLVEMIERDRNHPSILAWSVGNENWTFTPNSRSTYQTLRKVSKRFDPDRPITFAILQLVESLKEQTADLADFISVNEYFGWYIGKTEDVEDYLKKLHRRYPDKPIVVSEFGAGAVMDVNKIRKERKGGQGLFDPEYQARLIATQWAVFRRLDFVWGGMPWIFADFRNAWFKEEHPIPYFNLKGVLTYKREPKPAYYVLRNIYRDIERNPPPWAR